MAIVIEGPEDFKKELTFDKFMDEIVDTEKTKKTIKEETDEEEGDGRKILREYTERSNNRTRWSR